MVVIFCGMILLNNVKDFKIGHITYELSMVVTFCGMILLNNVKASAFLVFRGNGFIQSPEKA